jgi:hypothetical protein
MVIHELYDEINEREEYAALHDTNELKSFLSYLCRVDKLDKVVKMTLRSNMLVPTLLTIPPFFH